MAQNTNAALQARIKTLETDLSFARQEVELWKAAAAKIQTESSATITRLTAERDGIEAETVERCAAIADRHAKSCEKTGTLHPEESDSRSRMYARSREATYIAEDIRSLDKKEKENG